MEVRYAKRFDQFYKCKSQHWMGTEYDENVLDYWNIPNGNYMKKVRKDDGLDGDNDVKLHYQVI